MTPRAMRHLLAALAAAAATLTSCRAAPPSADEDGTRVVATAATPSDARLSLPDREVPRLTDAATGREIIDGRLGVVLREGRFSEPDIRIEPAPGGFDLIATYTNFTRAPIPLGTLRVPSIAMPREATWYDFRRGSEPVVFDHGNRGFRRADHGYPGDLYSPVAVLADDRHAVGASLLYDVFDAQHSVNVVLRTKRPAQVDRPGGEKRWVWSILFRLDGTLPPGETRTYTLAVRTAPADRWIETLLPYRDHFAATYGGLEYTRDARPVRGFAIAGQHEQSSENPRGFTFPQRRPDRHGFGPWVRAVEAEVGRFGFERVMVWALSGLHTSREANYPPIFATGLEETPRAAQSAGLWGRLTGASLGLWWGRSQQRIDSFSDRSIEFLDLGNADHVAGALAELDAAVALGADEIGLDAWAYLPAWNAAGWLRTLQARAPGVRFILEPSPADVLHRLAPAYTRAEVITDRHALADLILPGHETWAQVRFDTMQRRLGPLTPQQKQLEAERVAGLGFVPVLFEPIPEPARARASDAR